MEIRFVSQLSRTNLNVYFHLEWTQNVFIFHSETICFVNLAPLLLESQLWFCANLHLSTLLFCPISFTRPIDTWQFHTFSMKFVLLILIHSCDCYSCYSLHCFRFICSWKKKSARMRCFASHRITSIHWTEKTAIKKINQILSVYWMKCQELLFIPSDVLARVSLCTWGGWTVKAKAVFKLSFWTFAVYFIQRTVVPHPRNLQHLVEICGEYHMCVRVNWKSLQNYFIATHLASNVNDEFRAGP